MAAKKVLVDRNIESLQITADITYQTSTIKWGGFEKEVQIPGYIQKKYPENEQWKIDQINSLPAIQISVNSKVIELFSYKEIFFESLPANNPNGHGIGDILGNNFRQIDPAIEKSFFKSYDFNELGNREALMNFCLYIIKNKIENIDNSDLKERGLSDFQINNINNLDEFRGLCKNIINYPNEYPKLCDAFHLWTAEVNKMDYFLTADKKFINFIENKSKILNCQPVSPEQLLKALGIQIKTPLPLESNKFYPSYVTPPYYEIESKNFKFLQRLFQKMYDYAKHELHRLFSPTDRSH